MGVCMSKSSVQVAQDQSPQTSPSRRPPAEIAQPAPRMAWTEDTSTPQKITPTAAPETPMDARPAEALQIENRAATPPKIESAEAPKVDSRPSSARKKLSDPIPRRSSSKDVLKVSVAAAESPRAIVPSEMQPSVEPIDLKEASDADLLSPPVDQNADDQNVSGDSVMPAEAEAVTEVEAQDDQMPIVKSQSGISQPEKTSDPEIEAPPSVEIFAAAPAEEDTAGSHVTDSVEIEPPPEEGVAEPPQPLLAENPLETPLEALPSEAETGPQSDAIEEKNVQIAEPADMPPQVVTTDAETADSQSHAQTADSVEMQPIEEAAPLLTDNNTVEAEPQADPMEKDEVPAVVESAPTEHVSVGLDSQIPPEEETLSDTTLSDLQAVFPGATIVELSDSLCNEIDTKVLDAGLAELSAAPAVDLMPTGNDIPATESKIDSESPQPIASESPPIPHSIDESPLIQETVNMQSEIRTNQTTSVPPVALLPANEIEEIDKLYFPIIPHISYFPTLPSKNANGGVTHPVAIFFEGELQPRAYSMYSLGDALALLTAEIGERWPCAGVCRILDPRGKPKKLLVSNEEIPALKISDVCIDLKCKWKMKELLLDDMTKRWRQTESNKSSAVLVRASRIPSIFAPEISSESDLERIVHSGLVSNAKKFLFAISQGGVTSLHRAVSSDDVERVQFLLRLAERYDAEDLLLCKDSGGRTALHLAMARRGGNSFQIILELLRACGKKFTTAEFMKPDHVGGSPISYLTAEVAIAIADRTGHEAWCPERLLFPRCLERIRKSWEDPGQIMQLVERIGSLVKSHPTLMTFVERVSGRTLLHESARVPGDMSEPLVAKLLEIKCSPSTADASGRYPLHYAVQAASEKTALLLLQADRTVKNKHDVNARTPLHYWHPQKAGRSNIDALSLIELAPDFLTIDYDGTSPIHRAARCGQLDVFVALLNHFGPSSLLLRDEASHRTWAEHRDKAAKDRLNDVDAPPQDESLGPRPDLVLKYAGTKFMSSRLLTRGATVVEEAIVGKNSEIISRCISDCTDLPDAGRIERPLLATLIQTFETPDKSHISKFVESLDPSETSSALTMCFKFYPEACMQILNDHRAFINSNFNQLNLRDMLVGAVESGSESLVRTLLSLEGIHDEAEGVTAINFKHINIRPPIISRRFSIALMLMEAKLDLPLAMDENTIVTDLIQNLSLKVSRDQWRIATLILKKIFKGVSTIDVDWLLPKLRGAIITHFRAGPSSPIASDDLSAFVSAYIGIVLAEGGEGGDDKKGNNLRFLLTLDLIPNFQQIAEEHLNMEATGLAYLLAAALSQNVENIRYILGKTPHFDVVDKDSRPWGTLHALCHNRNPEVVPLIESLISKGADPLQRTAGIPNFENSVLCSQEDKKKCEDANSGRIKFRVPRKERVPLATSWAEILPNQNMVEKFPVFSKGENCFHIASRRANVHVLKALLHIVPRDKLSEGLEAISKSGYTPTQLAIAASIEGRPDADACVQMLFQAGATLDGCFDGWSMYRISENFTRNDAVWLHEKPGSSPLFSAASAGREDVVAKLLEMKVLPTACPSHRNPLIGAVISASSNIANLLVSAGAVVAMGPTVRENALLLATRALRASKVIPKSLEVLSVLIGAADAYTVKENLLEISRSTGNTDQGLEVLVSAVKKVFSSDGEQQPAFSVFERILPNVSMRSVALLEAVQPLNFLQNMKDSTILNTVLRSGDTAGCLHLLSNSSQFLNIESLDARGFSPLHLISMMRNRFDETATRSIIQKLVSLGAELEAKVAGSSKDVGFTAVCLAAKHGNATALSELISHKANLLVICALVQDNHRKMTTVRNISDLEPIELAAMGRTDDHGKCVEIILQTGFVETTTRDRALWWAAESANERAARALLEAGASINNSWGGIQGENLAGAAHRGYQCPWLLEVLESRGQRPSPDIAEWKDLVPKKPIFRVLRPKSDFCFQIWEHLFLAQISRKELQSEQHFELADQVSAIQKDLCDWMDAVEPLARVSNPVAAGLKYWSRSQKVIFALMVRALQPSSLDLSGLKGIDCETLGLLFEGLSRLETLALPSMEDAVYEGVDAVVVADNRRKWWSDIQAEKPFRHNYNHSENILRCYFHLTPRFESLKALLCPIELASLSPQRASLLNSKTLASLTLNPASLGPEHLSALARSVARGSLPNTLVVNGTAIAGVTPTPPLSEVRPDASSEVCLKAWVELGLDEYFDASWESETLSQFCTWMSDIEAQLRSGKVFGSFSFGEDEPGIYKPRVEVLQKIAEIVGPTSVEVSAECFSPATFVVTNMLEKLLTACRKLDYLSLPDILFPPDSPPPYLKYSWIPNRVDEEAVRTKSRSTSLFSQADLVNDLVGTSVRIINRIPVKRVRADAAVLTVPILWNRLRSETLTHFNTSPTETESEIRVAVESLLKDKRVRTGVTLNDTMVTLVESDLSAEEQLTEQLWHELELSKIYPTLEEDDLRRFIKWYSHPESVLFGDLWRSSSPEYTTLWSGVAKVLDSIFPQRNLFYFSIGMPMRLYVFSPLVVTSPHRVTRWNTGELIVKTVLGEDLSAEKRQSYRKEKVNDADEYCRKILAYFSSVLKNERAPKDDEEEEEEEEKSQVDETDTIYIPKVTTNHYAKFETGTHEDLLSARIRMQPLKSGLRIDDAVFISCAISLAPEALAALRSFTFNARADWSSRRRWVLSKALSLMTNLTYLDLSGTRLGVGIMLPDSLAGMAPSLTHLNLSGCALQGPTGVAIVRRVLPECNNLKYLNLLNSNLSAQATLILLRLTRIGLPALKTLNDFSWNDVPKEMSTTVNTDGNPGDWLIFKAVLERGLRSLTSLELKWKTKDDFDEYVDGNSDNLDVDSIRQLCVLLHSAHLENFSINNKVISKKFFAVEGNVDGLELDVESLQKPTLIRSIFISHLITPKIPYLTQVGNVYLPLDTTELVVGDITDVIIESSFLSQRLTHMGQNLVSLSVNPGVKLGSVGSRALVTAIPSLSNLRRLILRGVKFSVAIQEAAQRAILLRSIATLTKLTHLDLRDVTMGAASEKILAETVVPALPDLVEISGLQLDAYHGKPELDLRGQNLSSSELAIIISYLVANGSDSILKTLSIADNKFATIPPSIGKLTALESLDLSGCEVTTLPVEMGNLEKLETLEKGSFHKITSPPAEILDRGVGVTIQYLKRCQQTEMVRNPRLRLMIVGLGEAGKTSLIQAIRSEKGIARKIDADDRTIGVTVTEWNPSGDTEQSYPSYEPLQKDKLRFSCWDFAGQKIYYQSHQYFMTPRAVYVLVWRSLELVTRKDPMLQPPEWSELCPSDPDGGSHKVDEARSKCKLCSKVLSNWVLKCKCAEKEIDERVGRCKSCGDAVLGWPKCAGCGEPISLLKEDFKGDTFTYRHHRSGLLHQECIGFDKLVGDWLKKIQLRVPGATVVVVCTHAYVAQMKERAKKGLIFQIEKVGELVRSLIARERASVSHRISELRKLIAAGGGKLEEKRLLDRLEHASFVSVAAVPDTLGIAKGENPMNVFPVDSLKGYGIKDLKDTLISIGSELPQFGELVPDNWLQIRDVLQKLGKTRRLISTDELVPILNEQIPKGFASEDLEGAVRFLHELGDVLYFHDGNEALRKIIFLKPRFIMDAMKGIVNHDHNRLLSNRKKALEKKARLARSELRKKKKQKNEDEEENGQRGKTVTEAEERFQKLRLLEIQKAEKEEEIRRAFERKLQKLGRDGELTRDVLPYLWTGMDGRTRDSLLELMMAFEMVVEYAPGKFLVPCLLASRRHRSVNSAAFAMQSCAVRSRFIYDYLPEGFFSRLTVRCQKLFSHVRFGPTEAAVHQRGKKALLRLSEMEAESGGEIWQQIHLTCVATDARIFSKIQTEIQTIESTFPGLMRAEAALVCPSCADTPSSAPAAGRRQHYFRLDAITEVNVCPIENVPIAQAKLLPPPNPEVYISAHASWFSSGEDAVIMKNILESIESTGLVVAHSEGKGAHVESEVLVLMLDKNYSQSPHLVQEFKSAVEKRRKIFVVMCRAYGAPAFPQWYPENMPEMRALLFFDFREQRLDLIQKEIIPAVQRLLDSWGAPLPTKNSSAEKTQGLAAVTICPTCEASQNPDPHYFISSEIIAKASAGQKWIQILCPKENKIVKVPVADESELQQQALLCPQCDQHGISPGYMFIKEDCEDRLKEIVKYMENIAEQQALQENFQEDLSERPRYTMLCEECESEIPICELLRADCFISYNWGEVEWQDTVRRIKTRIEEDLEITCWLDKERMGSGQNLTNEMETGIRSASSIICFIDRKYIMSQNCKFELKFALECNKPIIFVNATTRYFDPSKNPIKRSGSLKRSDSIKRSESLKKENPRVTDAELRKEIEAIADMPKFKVERFLTLGKGGFDVSSDFYSEVERKISSQFFRGGVEEAAKKRPTTKK